MGQDGRVWPYEGLRLRSGSQGRTSCLPGGVTGSEGTRMNSLPLCHTHRDTHPHPIARHGSSSFSPPLTPQSQPGLTSCPQIRTDLLLLLHNAKPLVFVWGTRESRVLPHRTDEGVDLRPAADVQRGNNRGKTGLREASIAVPWISREEPAQEQTH